jgi:hypothetical protein
MRYILTYNIKKGWYIALLTDDNSTRELTPEELNEIIYKLNKDNESCQV